MKRGESRRQCPSLSPVNKGHGETKESPDSEYFMQKGIFVEILLLIYETHRII